MSKMQREKGKTYERQIASLLRVRFPGIVWRRASQAERADNPDVFADGDPLLDRLWLELQDARKPTPGAKLEQAEADAFAWRDRRGYPVAGHIERLPAVVWHRLGERTSRVTMRLWVLSELTGHGSPALPVPIAAPVTMGLEDFVRLLEAAVDRAAMREAVQ